MKRTLLCLSAIVCVLTLSAQDEQPQAKPRDASRVKFIK